MNRPGNAPVAHRVGMRTQCRNNLKGYAGYTLRAVVLFACALLLLTGSSKRAVAAVAPKTPAPPNSVSGAVYFSGLGSIPEEDYQKLLRSDAVRYVCFQQYWNHRDGSDVSPLTAKRAKRLAESGKCLIMQIFWGPGGEFAWSRYSFPNIALDPMIRAEFFRTLVDPVIDSVGAGSLYGVHLMEETGMQFGTDVPGRTDPEDFSPVPPLPSAYDAPFYSGYGALPGGVKIPNVRRHEADFTRMTGLRFVDEPRWGVLERHLFDTWVSRRLQSGGQIEFARHIRARYPRLKVFTWDLLRSGGENVRTDLALEARHFDGVIADVYNTPNFNFIYQRAYRKLFPKGEFIHFSMGGMGDASYPYISPDQKRALITGAYLAGVDIFGFFEWPHDFSRPDSWQANEKILRDLKALPRFQKKSGLLLLSATIGNIFSSPYAWTGLKYYDSLPTEQAYDLDYTPYSTVILHAASPVGDSQVFWNATALQRKYGLPGHIDYRRLDKFVHDGGTLLLSGQLILEKDCPLFIAREGFLHTEGVAHHRAEPLTIQPHGWLRDSLKLNREYRFTASQLRVVYDKSRVTETGAGYFFRYGKGAVFYFPFNRQYDTKEDTDSVQWQDYRQLLNDVSRGVLDLVGKAALAQTYFADPVLGTGYMQVDSDDGKIGGRLIFNHKLMKSPPWQVSGRDVFTGARNPRLNRDSSAALILRK